RNVTGVQTCALPIFTDDFTKKEETTHKKYPRDSSSLTKSGYFLCVVSSFLVKSSVMSYASASSYSSCVIKSLSYIRFKTYFIRFKPNLRSSSSFRDQKSVV